jgi:histidyl-tRNA synthetase
MSEPGWRQGLLLAQQLRRAGYRVLTDVRQGSLKSQMKRADRDQARFVLILGEEELLSESVTLKDMAADAAESDKQVRVPVGELLAWMAQRLPAGTPGGE